MNCTYSKRIIWRYASNLFYELLPMVLKFDHLLRLYAAIFQDIEEVILDFWHQSRSLFQNCIFLSNRVVCILLGCIMECPWCTLNGYKFKSHHSRYQSKPNLYAHVFLIFLFRKNYKHWNNPSLIFQFPLFLSLREQFDHILYYLQINTQPYTNCFTIVI